LLGSSFGDDFSAVGAGLGAKVDDPVGFGGDGHVVFDDGNRVSLVDEAVEDIDEAGDVFEVEADGRFFDEVEVVRGVARAVHLHLGAAAFDELGDEFDALGFAAGKRG